MCTARGSAPSLRRRSGVSRCVSSSSTVTTAQKCAAMAPEGGLFDADCPACVDGLYLLRQCEQVDDQSYAEQPAGQQPEHATADFPQVEVLDAGFFGCE